MTIGEPDETGPRRRARLGRAQPRHPKALLSLALAVLAGVLAHRLQVPLAWVLGPLVATAAAAIAGWPLFAPLSGRRAGQVVIGANIGLNVTAAVLASIVPWLPVMVGTAVLAMGLAAVLSVPFARASGIDGRTAYYAMMPGGLSEMANIGVASGAQAEPIALAQALRVALVVLVAPPLILSLGISGSVLEDPTSRTLSLSQTFLALALGLAGVGLARLARLNNPWMIGSLVGTGAFAATGVLIGHVPTALFYLGQFLIGLSIGSRFKRESVLRLPRLVLWSTFFIIALAACLFGYAAALSRLAGLDLATTALGVSPGGFAEMAVTAQTLHLSVGLVTAFHVVRALLVNAFAEHARVLLERIGLFKLLNRWVDGGSVR